jgi:hypothetical protein
MVAAAAPIETVSLKTYEIVQDFCYLLDLDLFSFSSLLFLSYSSLFLLSYSSLFLLSYSDFM